MDPSRGFLVTQILSQPVLRSPEGTADGAFVDAPLRGDLWDGLLLKIVGNKCLLLQRCQLRLNDPLDALQLYLTGKLRAEISVKAYISHSGNSPFRSIWR